MWGKVALLLVVVGCVVQTHADCYLHFPRGSNDRLNGQGRDRTNGNRLFDSQDNNRGGYNVGNGGPEYYYEGTLLPIQWTVQHSCGHPNIHCQIIMQYMCNGLVRDGLTESTIPDDPELDILDPRYGRHESYAWYQSCKARSRNKGLFIADRELNDNQGNNPGALYTRQNNNGNRHGYECPEERDYYPYWHPSPWKDIAILTDDTDKCASYRAESQNVKPRNYCAPDPAWQFDRLSRGFRGFVPITQLECEALDPPGTWVEVPAWNIPPPDCLGNVWTRDNHLGTPRYEFSDTLNSTTVSEYHWMLPNSTSDPLIFVTDPITGEQHSEHCIFRIRYNMTSDEFDTNSVGQNWPTPSTDFGGFASHTSAVGTTSNADWTKNSVRGRRGPSRVDVWSRYRITTTEVSGNLAENIPNNRNSDQRLADYQTTSQVTWRGYVLQGNDENPWVDIFGSLIDENTYGRIFHQLAVDTSQFGRTFQDRSHMFSIRQRPPALLGAKIHNFGVRGKRGNNQQTYPATEYEFTPERFRITKGDMVHFQWTGANTNNQGNAGQGTRGTDRSNVIGLTQKFQNKDPGSYSQTMYNWNVGQFQTNYPTRIDAASDSVNAPFLGYPYEDLRRLAKEGIYNPYFDLGPRQVTRTGLWHYMSTRNNNFTNRGQKGLIQVDNTATGTINLVQWGPAYNKRVTDSGDSWLLDDPYKFPISADVYVKGWGKDASYDSEWAQLLPVRFTVTPGSYQLMAMKFTYYPFMQPKVYWATNTEGQMMTEVKTSGVYTNVVEFPVNQGGFYVVKNAPDPGMIVGLVVAFIVIFGGGGYACLRYRRGWKVKPMTSSTGADVPLNVSSTNSSNTTGVEI